MSEGRKWWFLVGLVFIVLSGCEADEDSEALGQEKVEEEMVEIKEEVVGRPSEAQMKGAMQSYIDGFNQKDGALLASLFAEDGTIEDPVGGGKIVAGKEAIRAFYQGAVQMVDRLELDAPIRASRSNSAAMAFTIYMTMDGQEMVGRTIDVMTFDEAGKILEMKAYHGESDWE